MVFGTAASAQTSTASLNIMLSDVQSVKLSDKTIAETISGKAEITDNSPLQILSRATAQVKKMFVKTADYERLAKEFRKNFSKYSQSTLLADNRSNGSSFQPNDNETLHLVYQVDPR